MRQELLDALKKVDILTAAGIPLESLVERISIDVMLSDVIKLLSLIPQEVEDLQLSSNQRNFLGVKSLISFRDEQDLNLFLTKRIMYLFAKNAGVHLVRTFLHKMSPIGLGTALISFGGELGQKYFDNIYLDENPNSVVSIMFLGRVFGCVSEDKFTKMLCDRMESVHAFDIQKDMKSIFQLANFFGVGFELSVFRPFIQAADRIVNMSQGAFEHFLGKDVERGDDCFDLTSRDGEKIVFKSRFTFVRHGIRGCIAAEILDVVINLAAMYSTLDDTLNDNTSSREVKIQELKEATTLLRTSCNRLGFKHPNLDQLVSVVVSCESLLNSSPQDSSGPVDPSLSMFGF